MSVFRTENVRLLGHGWGDELYKRMNASLDNRASGFLLHDFRVFMDDGVEHPRPAHAHASGKVVKVIGNFRLQADTCAEAIVLGWMV